MIDTHAHLNFPDFGEDLEAIIKKSFKNGLEKIIVPGSDIENSRRAVGVAEKYDGIFAAVGIHPHFTKEIGDFSVIEKLAESGKAVAIGETGLDYFRLSFCHSREGGNPDPKRIKRKQKKLFSKHIELAEKTGLPLILHNRDSNEDFLEIVSGRKVKAVVHCFTSDLDFAKKVLSLGFLVSFTGIITFDKTGSLEEVVKGVPLDKIMVETDSPLLAPVPYRGQRAEPWMVKEVIQKIAGVKGLSFEEVEAKTTTTAKKFFNI